MVLTRRQTLQSLSGAIGFAALPLSAKAHRQKTTLSQIEWSETDRALYVTHSFHMHDAETALAAKGIIHKPDLTSLKARARLALYTSEHFNLYVGGEKIELEILGAEFHARTVYVYQQIHLEDKPAVMTISADMLRDIIPGQINNVDVKLDGKVKSVQFKDNDGPKKVLA